jgi:tetratricopeptide (TPR) repeat protein
MKKKITLILVLTIALSIFQNASAQNNQWSATDKFRNCMTSMQSTNDELTRFNYAMNYFLTEHSTTIQLQDACHYLYNDQKKYELCVAAYPNIIDKDHFFNIYDSFSKFSFAIKLYHNTQEKQQLTTLENNYQLNVEQDNDAIYDLLIEKGDLLLSNNQFDGAILIYQQALEIKPSDQIAIGKINDVEAIQTELTAILEAENQLNSQFDVLIQNGDVFLSANQVDEAIAMYEQAMALKPSDETTYLRIKEANAWKTEISNMVENENQKRTEYDFLMQKGEIFVSSNKFDEAISVYQQASVIFPVKQMPYIKIEEANRLKQELANANSICTTSETEFNHIKTSIDDQSFADDQMEMAKKYIQKKCFTIEQMKAIIPIFSMDNDKLEMIKYMYDYSYQQNKFYEFRGLLTFSSTQKELDEFLVGK